MACPDDTVTFTCILPGAVGVTIRWTVTPPPELNVNSATGSVNNRVLTINIGSGGFMFQADYSGHNGGMVTSTLTTITMVTVLARAMVDCQVIGGAGDGPISIVFAGKCMYI